MIQHPDLLYIYDGSYEGLLTCVFESFARKEIPLGIQTEEEPQLTLSPSHHIAVDEVKARRVAASLSTKLGPQITEFFQLSFLTCLPDRELHMLRFLHLAYQYGPKVLGMLANETVHTLYKAQQHLTHEAHLLKGFIRFSDYHSFLVTVIHPKNFVLPLLQPHFSDRFSQESFLIFDENHSAALFHRPGRSQIIPLTELLLNAPDAEEQKYRALWQAYYQTIAIKARYNPKCRMSHMPKRYWDYMTEFGAQGIVRYQQTFSDKRTPLTGKETPESLPLLP